MTKFIYLFIYLLSVLSSNAQCSLTIRVIGKQSDTLLVGNYKDSTLVKVNDSTFKFTATLSSPDRVMFMIDRKDRWWTAIWIEPHIKNKELVIDYNKKSTFIKNPTEWDRITDETGKLEDLGKFSKEITLITNFIDKNPNSYLSLWFFKHSHAMYTENRAEKFQLFKKLSQSLTIYPEYKQLRADLLERKYPLNGDLFKEFTLEKNDGTRFKTDTIKDKWILLNFWSTNCGPCIKELDSLISFNNHIDKSKALIISISLDEDKNKWNNSKNTNKILWTSVWQKDGFYGELCLHYNVYSMPFFILFNNEKKMFFIKDGSDEIENIKTFFKKNKLLK
jgi:thiol-disulfide isomerase/thioredoxin